jgi:hypothetical protein
MLLAAVYKSPLRVWSAAQIKQLLNFRTKSNVADDLNAKTPVWNSYASNPSDLNLLDLFINFNFAISAPQYPTHFVPDGTGDVLDNVVHQNVRPSEVTILNIRDSDHLPITFSILDHV